MSQARNAKDNELLEEFVRELLAHAPNEPVGEHLEEPLLVSASLGTLAEEERPQVVDHLATCRECRAVLDFMMEDDFEQEPLVVPAPTSSHSNWFRWGLAFVLVASVLLAWGFGSGYFSAVTDPLQPAREALAQNHPEQAYELLQQTLDSEQLQPQAKEEALVLLRQAGARWGKQLLSEGQFEKVQRLCLQMKQREASTLEFDLLAFAALLEQRDPMVFNESLALADIGVEIDGAGEVYRDSGKAPSSETRTSAGDIIEPLLEQHPTNRTVLFDYLFWLLLQNYADDVVEYVTPLTQPGSTDREAWVLLGLASVLNRDRKTAIRAFERALALRDDDVVRANLEAVRRMK